MNLHLQPSNPGEGGGIPLTDALTGTPANVTGDFDDQIRGTLTPIDIGADAGNFTLIDIIPPVISPVVLGDTLSLTNRELKRFATISDNVGVAGGAKSPRLYFKKATDDGTFNTPNDSTGRGWKSVTASNALSPYDFTINYALLYGGGVTNGDTIQYFIIAQDVANNFVSSPSGAGIWANPPVQYLSSRPLYLNTYRVGDITAPVITYPMLSSGSTANRVLSNWATITDNVGVASGASAPRLYYRKHLDSDYFNVANDSTGDGWKYVSATGSGPYSFTMDYSKINGGSVNAGDIIFYFVVAQDITNNLGSSPAFAKASGSPPVQHVTSYWKVNRFNIINATNLSGTVSVGNGGTYPNLSGSDGLFAALNTAMLTGNVVVNIISDLLETGEVMLNELNSEGFPFNNALTIQPDSPTMRTISGDASYALISLNGTDRVTIDGRYGGSGRWLTFRNTRQTGPVSTIVLKNDASNNTVRNCNVEGPRGSVIALGEGSVTGNNNNLITDCKVRGLRTPSGMAGALISSSSLSSSTRNSGNTISKNELVNFDGFGIQIESGNASWTISDYIIYEEYSGVGHRIGISMSGVGTNIMTGNAIYDLPNIVGMSTGISASVSDGSTLTIARNRITIRNVGATTFDIYGLCANASRNSTINVVNNQITLRTDKASSLSRMIYGLCESGDDGSVINVFHNSIIIGGTETGTGSSWASWRRRANTHTARNNLFLNFRTGAPDTPGSHFAAGSEVTGGTYTASHNIYTGTGATKENFMNFGTLSGSPVPVSFATWQSLTGDTNSQSEIAGSGNFTDAIFFNASTGDLHLVPGGNALVNALGIPVPGLTDDYDGDPRPASAPTIGSDQIPFADIAVAQTSALSDGGTVNFGTATLGSGSSARTFTITNPGSAALTSLAVAGGTGEFVISMLSGTSVPVGSSVTFTVTFTPAAYGLRNATLQIASNVTGTKNPFDIALTGTGNAPPTFSGYTLKVRKNAPVSVGFAKILARAADADGGTPAIASVSATTTQGGSVSLGGSSVAYAPPLNFTGLDTFAVTIIDGQGGSIIVTVTCAVSEGNAAITNEPQITRQPGGNVALLFLGIPGQTYKVQRSTDLQIWTLLETATTAPDGTLPSLDPSPPEGSAFYRIVVP